MKKRLLSLLLAVAMVATMIVLPTYAAEEAEPETQVGYCQHCKEQIPEDKWLPWDPLNIFALPSSKSKPRTENHQRTNYGATGTPPPAGDAVNAPVTQRELDTLLDKLSREGINSLSPFEFERLKKARRQMRGEE